MHFITSPPRDVQSVAIFVSVCLSVRSRISEMTCSNFTRGGAGNFWLESKVRGPRDGSPTVGSKGFAPVEGLGGFGGQSPPEAEALFEK